MVRSPCFGNDNADSITFAGGLSVTALSRMVIQGTVAAINTPMTVGDGNTGITSNGSFGFPAIMNAGSGNIVLAGNITGVGLDGSNNPVKPITSGAGSTLLSGTNTAEVLVTTGVVTIANPADQAGGYRVSGGTLRGGSASKIGYIYA
ncbi:MAG: hypothetical protein WCI09_09730 [Planctomycetota bacterium]